MAQTKLYLKDTYRQTVGAPQRPSQPSQRRLMLIALSLLLVALGIVLYRDRDFWFPDTQEADDQEVTEPSADTAPQTAAPVIQPNAAVHKKFPISKRQHKGSAINSRSYSDSPVASSSQDLPFATVTQRTALPPLEVEVVAGDIHRHVRPGSNAVRVDLQPGSVAPAVPVSPPSEPADAGPSNSAASLTRNAADRVQLSADTVEAVTRPVNPGYPLLARQMKVQGSVILQALIGRDGLIQNLHVLSGPPILASAAQEAVKKWHFKPHYQGAEAIETQAKITVNFTISTN